MIILVDDATAAPFKVPSAILWVTGLWYTSLTCSLGVAMIAIMVKQWLHFYELNNNTETYHNYAHRRQFRLNAFLTWQVPVIISTLPVMTYMSVGLFLAGMVVQLWQMNLVIAHIVLALLSILGAVYVTITILPSIYPDCPYYNGTSVLTQKLVHLICQWWSKAMYMCCKFLSKISRTLPNLAVFTVKIENIKQSYNKSQGYQRHNTESDRIKQMQTALNIDSIIWLINTSQNTDPVDTALEASAFLQYTPNMIDKCLRNRLPDILISKAYIPLPSDDDNFWEQLQNQNYKKAASTVIVKMPSMDRYLTSLIHLWCQPSVHDITQSAPISPDRLSSPHSWIFGDWIVVWRKLYLSNTKTTLPLLAARGWKLDTFVLITCAETLYFYIHPANKPLYMQNTPSTDIRHPNPFFDLQQFLEDYISDYLALDEKKLSAVLGALFYALKSYDLQLLMDTRQDTLMILIRLLGHDSIITQCKSVLHRVSACLQLFLTTSTRANLTNSTCLDPSDPLYPMKDLCTTLTSTCHNLLHYCTLARSHTNNHPESFNKLQYASETIIDSFFNFAAWHYDSDTLVGQDIIMQLSSGQIDQVVDKLKRYDQLQWQQVRSISWIVKLLWHWYHKETTLTIRKARILRSLENILCLEWHSQKKWEIILVQILPVLLQRLETPNPEPAAQVFSDSDDPKERILYVEKFCEIDCICQMIYNAANKKLANSNGQEFFEDLIQARILEKVLDLLSAHALVRPVKADWRLLRNVWRRNLNDSPYLTEAHLRLSKLDL